MNITGIDVEKTYYIETDEPGFESMTRYGEKEWVVNYSGEELRVKNTKEIEIDFQRTLLLNLISDN